MVFSVFLNPVQRLLSSFHFGILSGANSPDQDMYYPINQRKHHERVVEARRIATISNDTILYQGLLRDYLVQCSDAAKHAYVAFLDPLTKNLPVVLNHLERYVIVGMYREIKNTLQRWINITLNSCHGHPEYSRLEEMLSQSIKSGGDRKTRVNPSVKDSVILFFPDILQLDKDMQDLI